jgi:hypothetical protein
VGPLPIGASNSKIISLRVTNNMMSGQDPLGGGEQCWWPSPGGILLEP